MNPTIEYLKDFSNERDAIRHYYFSRDYIVTNLQSGQTKGDPYSYLMRRIKQWEDFKKTNPPIDKLADFLINH